MASAWTVTSVEIRDRSVNATVPLQHGLVVELVVGVVPKHTDQGVEFGHCVGARPFDGVHCVVNVLGLIVLVPECAGEQNDAGDGVADGVVELTSHPVALFGDGALAQRGLLCLELGEPATQGQRRFSEMSDSTS